MKQKINLNELFEINLNELFEIKKDEKEINPVHALVGLEDGLYPVKFILKYIKDLQPGYKLAPKDITNFESTLETFEKVFGRYKEVIEQTEHFQYFEARSKFDVFFKNLVGDVKYKYKWLNEAIKLSKRVIAKKGFYLQPATELKNMCDMTKNITPFGRTLFSL